MLRYFGRRYQVEGPRAMCLDRCAMETSTQTKASGRASHLFLARHKAVSKPPAMPRTTFWKAMRAFFPWDAFRYPGIEAGAVELAQGRATVYAIRAWRQGARRVPRWMWHLIAIEAERRAAAFLHVAELAKKEAGD